MGDHDDQIDALSYGLHEMARRLIPVYFGHPRGDSKTDVAYHALGSQPYGEVGVVFGRGSYPAGSPPRRIKVMSLGTGKVLVLDGPAAGTIK